MCRNRFFYATYIQGALSPRRISIQSLGPLPRKTPVSECESPRDEGWSIHEPDHPLVSRYEEYWR